ncbi:MAG: DUF2085 domain-containing protein [Actinobacteria bacterium]|nr:DUF2085 domain-containing protein [Actinomycetota bacterium]
MQSIADFIIDIMNQVGFAVCHQLPERTFKYSGMYLPVCARDTGLFLGIAVCFIALFIAYRREACTYPSPFKSTLLACFVVPMLLDIFTVSAGMRITTNNMRLATGSFAGTGIAALVFPIVSGVFFKEGETAVMFRKWWHTAFLFMIPAGIFIVVPPEFSSAYWIWAPAVTAAILFTFFVLNYTFIVLAIEWWRGGDRPGPGASMIFYAGLAAAVELVLFNRLHWLVDKLL